MSELLKDDLFQLLATVKNALGLMANGIVESDGAIADFQGDAALGFWGWPMPLPDGPVPACRAALSIVIAFEKKSNCDGMLEGFSVGIGIAHGVAIAGEIGTDK
jgi:adenylate cyclase